MSRKTVPIRVAVADTPALDRGELHGTQDAWVAAEAGAVPPPGPGADCPAGKPEPGGASALRAPALIAPSLAVGAALWQGADEVARIWSDAVAARTQRSAEGAYRSLWCWTPLHAAALHRELAAECLADVFRVTAQAAHATEQAARKAAGELASS